jgi:hypothetical protein
MKLKFPKEFYKDLIIGTVFMCIALILTVILWVTSDNDLETIFGGVVFFSLFMGYIKLAPVVIAYPHLKSDNCDDRLEADVDATEVKSDFSDDVNN